MCTVVTDWQDGRPLRILAIRDELVSRPFDDPGAWWADQPDVVGGRDRTAGGTWCASDLPTGRTALVLNRRERRTGTPSRGILPLAALRHATAWPDHVDVRDMASFTLLLAGPAGVRAWSFDAVALREAELSPGRHLTTVAGVDVDDAKTARWAPQFERPDWPAVVAGAAPGDEPDDLLVRHQIDQDVYASVFAQQIVQVPGQLDLRFTRTPGDPGSWRHRGWPAG